MTLIFFFSNPENGLSDHKGLENINYTTSIVKFGESFNGRHTALTSVAVKPYFGEK